MTEDEYLRYWIWVWKIDHPDGLVKYPIDNGCNCLHRTYWEWEHVQKTTHHCHCWFVWTAFRYAGMRFVWNDYDNWDPRVPEESKAAWYKAMERAVKIK